MRNLIYSALMIAVVLSAGVLAKDELDASFNSTGIQTVSLGIHASSGIDEVIQSDNKIVVAGSCQPSSYQECVARYNEDGSLDTTFAQQGFLVNFGVGSGSRIALQNDGKIIVAGSVRVDTGFPTYAIRVVLSRYTTDGVLDSSFGGGNVLFSAGMGLASPREMVIQPDGKIVVVGESTPYMIWPAPYSMGWIARYLPNGTPDPLFGTNGVVNFPSSEPTQTAVTSVAGQPDGKILLSLRTGANPAGYQLRRLNPDGSLDASWGGGDGILDLPAIASNQDTIRNLQVMLDGRIVGTIARNILRFNPDGSLDNSFDGDGIRQLGTTTGDPYDLAISASGKITMAGLAPSSAGYNYRFSVYKFRVDGSTETGFGDNGLIVLDPLGSGENSYSSTVAFDTQGRTVAGGNATSTPNRFALVRLVAPPVMLVEVSGRVMRADGNGVSNAIVSTQGGLSVRTNPLGYYTLSNVPTNRTYTVSIRARDGSAFDKRTVLVDDNLANFNFTALAPEGRAEELNDVKVKAGPLPSGKDGR